MRIRVFLMVGVLLAASASHALAQRGGRGGRGGDENPQVAVSKTQYDNKALGIRFGVPPGLTLYTREMPGKYRSVLSERKIVLLATPTHADDTITFVLADGMTEADVKGYRDVLEKNPPQAKLPGFEKVSVGAGKFGDKGIKDGIDYVYRTTQGGTAMTYRQVVFVHNGRGFTLTCAAVTKDFEMANREWCEKVVRQIEFY